MAGLELRIRSYSRSSLFFLPEADFSLVITTLISDLPKHEALEVAPWLTGSLFSYSALFFVKDDSPVASVSWQIKRYVRSVRGA